MNKRLSAALLSIMVLSGGMVGCGSLGSNEPNEEVVQEKTTEITLDRVLENPLLLKDLTEMEIDFGAYINNLEAEIKIFTIEEEKEIISNEMKIYSNNEDLTSLELSIEDGVIIAVNMDEFNGMIDESPYKGSLIKYDYATSERYNEFEISMLEGSVENIKEKYEGNDIQIFWDEFKVIIPDSKIVNTVSNKTLEIYGLNEETSIMLLMNGSTIEKLYLNEELDLSNFQ